MQRGLLLGREALSTAERCTFIDGRKRVQREAAQLHRAWPVGADIQPEVGGCIGRAGLVLEPVECLNLQRGSHQLPLRTEGRGAKGLSSTTLYRGLSERARVRSEPHEREGDRDKAGARAVSCTHVLHLVWMQSAST